MILDRNGEILLLRASRAFSGGMSASMSGTPSGSKSLHGEKVLAQMSKPFVLNGLARGELAKKKSLHKIENVNGVAVL